MPKCRSAEVPECRGAEVPSAGCCVRCRGTCRQPQHSRHFSTLALQHSGTPALRHISEQHRENRLLRVQPVLGLVEHDGPRAVEDTGGDFLAAVRRQAMHEERVRLGARHQRLVDLIAGKRPFPFARFVLLSHRRPDVGVDGARALDRGLRVGEQPKRRAVTRQARDLLLDSVRQDVAVRRGQVHVHAGHHRRLRQRGRDVVAVADVRDGAAGQRAEPLLQREQVGHGLARVLLVGECVHDVQARSRGGELLEHLLRERADDDGIDPALEVARDVGRRLPAAERDVGWE